MEDRLQPAKSDLSNLSLKDLFFKYVRFLPLIILSVALALLVSYLYLRYANLIYRSSGMMVMKEETGGGGTNRLDEILQQDGVKNIPSEIEVLKSRPLMERVVRHLNLSVSYVAVGKIKEMNVYRDAPFRLEIFEKADSLSSFSLNIKFTGGEAFRVNDGNALFTFGQVFRNRFGVFRLVRVPNVAINEEYNLIYAPPAAVAAGLSSELVISPKANTGILVLMLESTNARMAADVINQLMLEYEEVTIEEKNNANRRTLEFVDSRLTEVQRSLDSITQHKISYQQANNLISFEAQSGSYLGRVEASDAEINDLRVQLNTAEMISEYLARSSNQYTRVPSTLGLNDPTLSNLIALYNVGQLERQQLIEDRVPSGNPLLRQKEEQIALLRTRILESLRNVRASLQSGIGNLQRNNAQVETQIRALPLKQQNLIEIERQQQTKLAVFNFLSEKREESAIALASTTPNSRVLELAMPNFFPVKPDRFNVQLLAILIGVLIPALGIFIAELLNDKVSTRGDIERITSAPILGEVGHSFNRNTMVVVENNRSVVAEQFRIIRSNLQYVLNNISKPVIMVTSSFSGEGKSFISTNMGAVLALTGKKTVILEFDIRKPKILSGLNMDKKPGLSNYLLGKVSADALPVPIEGHQNLFVLPCGPIPPNPSELLLDPKLNELFEYLHSAFDVVVMDTAPVGMVSDAMTLGRFANCTLYIVRQGHTYKRQIALLDEFHEAGKLPKVSIVMNDVKIRSGYGYYGYGRYGYGYGYGAGSGYFDEEDAPLNRFERMFSWLDLNKWNGKEKNTRKRKKKPVQ